MVYSSCAVANAFLNLAKKEGKTLTNMQVQKLVYFAHGYTLGFIGEPLIRDEVRAWTFGPVIPVLYDRLQIYGRNPIAKPLEVGYDVPVDFVSNEGQVIRSVWEAFKDLSAGQLSNLSHQKGSPWYQVWTETEFGEIPNDITAKFYKKLIEEQPAQ